MSSFVTLNHKADINNINLSTDWKDSPSFSSKNRIVGENGGKITSSYKGTQYQVFLEKKREFTPNEKIWRKLIGTIVVIFTLGIAIFFQSVRNLLTQEKAKIRFAVPAPPIKEELEEGIDIPEEMTKKIHSCMQYIVPTDRQDAEILEQHGLKLHTHSRNHQFQFFYLEKYPKLIFKLNRQSSASSTNKPYSMEPYYRAMIKTADVRRMHDLSLIRIPHAKLLGVQYEGINYEIVVEERLALNPQEELHSREIEWFQEGYFEKYGDRLDPAIEQLATLVCETGRGKINWGNNKVLVPKGNQDPIQIALIGFESSGDPQIGLFGGDASECPGLVRCVNEKQGNIVKKIAQRWGISTREFSSAHRDRKEDLAEIRKIKAFLSTKGIVNGTEPITVDTATLRFQDFCEEFTEEEINRLKEGAEAVVKVINQKIASKRKDLPVRFKRRVVIGAPYEKSISGLSSFVGTLREREDLSSHYIKYMGVILRVLANHGYIFKNIGASNRAYVFYA